MIHGIYSRNPIEASIARVPANRLEHRSPDNVASDNAGNLYIIEQNSPGDIRVARSNSGRDGVAENVALFESLTTRGAKGSGNYSAPGMPKIMVQSSIKPFSRSAVVVAVSGAPAMP